MSSISSPQILVFIVLRNIFSSLEFAQLSFLYLILQQGLRPQASGSQGNNCQVVKYTECGKCGRCVFPFHWFFILTYVCTTKKSMPTYFHRGQCLAVQSSQKQFVEVPLRVARKTELFPLQKYFRRSKALHEYSKYFYSENKQVCISFHH